MTCEEFLPFIDAYVDQEFDERERAEMDVHLGACPACRQRVEAQLHLKRQFKACLADTHAPDSLRARIFEGLEAQLATDTAEAEVIELPVAEPQKSFLRRHAWLGAPLAAAVALLIALPAFTIAPAQSGQQPVIEQTIDWHVGNYPIEVTGPDGSRVSSWFRNKVDFPVRVPQFDSDSGANLLGGRIAHIGDRRAAYLVYEVDGSRLSVLAFDGDGLTIPSDKIHKLGDRDVVLSTSKGYEVAILQDQGITYAITSELPHLQFVSVVQSSLQR